MTWPPHWSWRLEHTSDPWSGPDSGGNIMEWQDERWVELNGRCMMSDKGNGY